METPRPLLDVARLPTFGFGAASSMWWGGLGFILIELMGFVLAGGAYLYVAQLNGGYPIGAPAPALGPGTALAVLLVASEAGNVWLDRVARRLDLRRVRIGLVLMSVVGLAACALRVLEFQALNIRWDDNAYGSLLWFLIGLHATHLGTDVADTIVLTVLMFTRHGRGRRFSDVTDNCAYWHFVVLSWLPIYALMHGVPRL